MFNINFYKNQKKYLRILNKNKEIYLKFVKEYDIEDL